MNDLRYRCRECSWTGIMDSILREPSPFNAEYTILGCPKCFSVECFEQLCDEPNCNQLYSIGSPTKNGYRMTCHIHMPPNSELVTPQQFQQQGKK